MLSVTRYSIKNKKLKPWIKFIWYLEANDANIYYKILPTDCIDVILNLSGNIVYENSFCTIPAVQFHVNGLRSSHNYIRQTGKVRVFGISFYSFGLFPFVNKSLDIIQNKIVDLHNLSNPLTQKLKSVLCNTENIIDAVALIETVLYSELRVNDDYIFKANLINDFIETNDKISVYYYCDKLKINIKTFERMFLYYTGYLPKMLYRIKRFQLISNQLTHQRPENLTDIAYNYNFADQSHFVNDFHKFSGSSPRNFQQEKISVKENVEYIYE